VTEPRLSRIEYFFDPSCPWTWMTSRWLTEAAGARDIPVEWRSLSLYVLNEGKDLPEKYKAPMEAARRVHRIIAALRAEGRNDLVAELYTEWGRRFHHDGEPGSDELVAEVAETAAVGKWADAADDETWDGDVRASTAEAQGLAGPDVGSPVIAMGEPRRGMFGPLLSPPPSGDAAVALLDHVAALVAQDGFWELKRGRTQEPQFGPRP
jgi:2-hydroxychromene-2-carboxylate isomerase